MLRIKKNTKKQLGEMYASCIILIRDINDRNTFAGGRKVYQYEGRFT